ncbi:hypothetical protein Tco_0575746 [Tanacetum coccineum]
MPTEMELTLEQTQQGVSYEVSNIQVISFIMKMEILLEPTLNKLMVEHAEFDESDTYVLERFDTSAGNHVKEILLKLNLPNHRSILIDLKDIKDGGEEEDFVIREGVVVLSSSLDRSTKSYLGGIMVSLFFLEGLEEEACMDAMEVEYK